MAHRRVREIALFLTMVVAATAGAAAQTTDPSNATPAEPEKPEAPVEAPVQPPPAAPAPWWERLTLFGDFRLRYDGIYQAASGSRHRQRYRLRLGVRAPLADGLDFSLRLASGEPGDVTSTNQTFSEFFNRKPINLDQLWLTWRPEGLPALILGAGKFPPTILRTQMVWDDDVNWEGVYQQASGRVGRTTVRLGAVQSPLLEVGAREDSFMFAQHAQADVPLGRVALRLSLADYVFRNPDPLALALEERVIIRTQHTNALRRDAAGRVVGFQSGFHLVDAIAQATVDSGRPAWPVTLMAEYVVNTRAVRGEDAGIWLVGSVGRAATPRTASASYTFARIERDAVLSAFNFSDMVPATNVRTHLAAFTYMPRRGVHLDATAILTRRLGVPPGATNPLVTRVLLDARVAF